MWSPLLLWMLLHYRLWVHDHSPTTSSPTIPVHQRLQNVCASIVSLTLRWMHIMPVLKNLHWLPIKERIEFKVLLLTYKALNGLSPIYITEMTYKPSKTLCSGNQLLLHIPAITTTTLGNRTCSYVVLASKLWNTLQSQAQNPPLCSCLLHVTVNMYIDCIQRYEHIVV